MNFDIELVRDLAKKYYMSHVQNAFGQSGIDVLPELLDFARIILRECPPERITGSITFVRRVTSSGQGVDSWSGAVKILSDQQLQELVLAIESNCHGFVEKLGDGQRYFSKLNKDIDLAMLAKHSIVLRYHDGKDTIYSGSYSDELSKVSHLQLSSLATPTYTELEEALRQYGCIAEHCSCKILERAWGGGANSLRLVFSPKPESHMRDSLVGNLSAVLKDATVTPEHNTDATKPVDVKVDWFGRRATALIEIKWLGKALTATSTADKETYTSYTEVRARDGSTQLADYLEREKQTTSGEDAKGYVVVFDGRRAKVVNSTTAINPSDAMAYENSEITYESEILSRNDMAEPVRFFLKPRLLQAA